MKRILLSLWIGVVLCASLGAQAQDAFVEKWEKSYSTEGQSEIIQCMDVGDLDKDGSLEIVLGLIVRPHAGIQKYAVQIVDRNGERKQRWDSAYLPTDVSIADIENDGNPEILVSSADIYLLSNKAQNLNYPPIGKSVFTAEAADLDKDGTKEILIGTRELTCKGKALNWNVSIGSQVKKILISDINWDAELEIVVLTQQSVYVLDKNGKKLWVSPGTQNLRDMALADVDGDHNEEILFSTDNMLILIWEAREGGEEGRINLASYKVDHMAVADVNQDGQHEIVVASSLLSLHVLDLKGNALWFKKFATGETQDTFSSMALADLDGDHWTDVLLARTLVGGGVVGDSLLYFMKNSMKAPPVTGSTTQDLYNSALELFNKGNCTEAVPLFTQAQAAFTQEGNQNMASQCQTYLDQCHAQVIQGDAASKVTQAEQLIGQEKYDEAATLLQEAISLYEELGDSEKVQSLSERLTEVQNMKTKPEETLKPEEKRNLGRLIVVVVVAAVVGIAFFVVKSRKATVGRPVVTEKKEVRAEKVEKKEKKAVPSERVKEEERKLKAQFVYGEISKEEYREKLKQLYESEGHPAE